MSARVGVVVYGVDRAPGGIARYTRALLEGLPAAGVPIVPLYAGSAGSGGGAYLRGARRLPALLTIGQMELRRVARRYGLDLVHDPSGNAPLLLVEGKRIVTIHDTIPHIYPETSTRLDRLIHRVWLPRIVPRLDAVITGSRQARSDLLKHLNVRPANVAVIPLAAGPRFRPLTDDEVAAVRSRYDIRSPYVLFVGSIEARKNLPRVLHSFAQLHQTVPDARLVVVGARKWRFGSVFETVGDLRLESVVDFLGYVEDRDLPAIYGGARLFVYPSLYEGFGLPVLEAMACGTPVITSSSSSLPEVAGEAALLVDPTDAAALARQMRRLWNDGALALELRERGLAQAQLFSWKRTIEATIQLYEQVLGEPVRAGTT